MGYKYSEFFKAEVICEARKGLRTQKQIAQQFGIPEETLSRWMNGKGRKREKKTFVEPLFLANKPKKKQYLEMSFGELLDCLPSRENKAYATYLHEQYKDKGIALRYCYVVLNPSTTQQISEN